MRHPDHRPISHAFGKRPAACLEWVRARKCPGPHSYACAQAVGCELHNTVLGMYAPCLKPARALRKGDAACVVRVAV